MLGDDAEMLDVGRELRSHREQRGLTLSEAAQRTGVPRLRLDLIERGSLPPPSILQQLISGLGIESDLAEALEGASRNWRRPQPDDWGGGTCTVVTVNYRTGEERRKEWYYFVLDRHVGPCFLEPAGVRARWVRDLIANPRIRVAVNDGVYEGVARVSAEEAETAAVKELFRRKYGAHHDPAVDDLLTRGTAIVATDEPIAVARSLADYP